MEQQQQTTKDEFDPKCKGAVAGLRAAFPFAYGKGSLDPLIKALGAEPRDEHRGGKYGSKRVLAFTNGVRAYLYKEETLIELSEGECARLSSGRGYDGSDASRIEKEIAARGRWLDVLRSVEELGGRLTNLTLRVYDQTGFFAEDEIERKLETREYVSALRDCRAVMKDKYSGSAYLLGNGKTRTLAIYRDYPWRTVFEIEYHGASAQTQGKYFADCLSHETEKWYFLTSLASAIEFKENGGSDDSHRSAARKWARWDEFLSGVGKAEWIALPGEYDAIAKKERWLRNEAGKAIAQVALAKNETFEDVAMRLYSYGKHHMSESEFNDVNAYRASHGFGRIPHSMAPYRDAVAARRHAKAIAKQSKEENQ